MTKFHGGDAYNVIPEQAELAGTVRTLKPEVASPCPASASMRSARASAAAAGASVDGPIRRRLSGDRQPSRARPAIAADVAADDRRRRPGVDRAMQPMMGGEDFSYMLEARPGAFIFIGNGDTRRAAPPGL